MEKSEIMRFTISGVIPSKKNSHQIRKNKDKTWIAPSDTYQSWEKIHAETIGKMYPEHHDLVGPLSIEYIFHPDSKRRFDMSNKIESINDMLVSSGIIKDDNIFIMSDLHMRLGSMSTSGDMEVEVIINFI